MHNSADSRIDYRFVVPLALVLLIVAVVTLTQAGEQPGVRHLSQVAVWVATVVVLVAGARSKATFRAALAVIAVFAAASYFDYGRFHGGGRFLHDHEFYHYYVGSKYFPELGYEGLYGATYRALYENDQATAESLKFVKNLRTYQLESAAVCQQRADGIIAAFSEARWQEFKSDIGFFQSRLRPEAWQLLLIDHGYNATPFWTALGSFLSDRLGLDNATLGVLASLDLLLIALMLVMVARSFGVDAALLFAIFFFANLFAVFDITGGAFLRQLWLAGVVAFACFYTKGRMVAAGVALAIATLDRVFPMILAALPLTMMLVELWRERTVSRPAMHFAAGFVGTLVVFGGLITAITGGLSVWLDFYANISAHERWYYINQISLRNLFIVDPTTAIGTGGEGWDESAWVRERAARDQGTVLTLQAVRGVMVALLVALIASERRPVVALGMLAFAPFILLYPANYYHGVLWLGMVCWLWWPRLAVAIAATQAVFWGLSFAFPSPGELEFVNWVVSLILAGTFVAFVVAGLVERCRANSGFRRVVIAIVIVGALAVAGGIGLDFMRTSGEDRVVDVARVDVIGLRGATARSETMVQWGSGWSLNDHLVVLANQAGAQATVRVPGPYTGRQRLKVDYTASPAFGFVQLTVNGQAQAGATNLFSPRVGKRPAMYDGELQDGDNQLVFTVTGKDPMATAAHFGIDRIVLGRELPGDPGERDFALVHALDWVRSHPADAFDGGYRGICNEIIVLATLAAKPEFADADDALLELQARVAALDAAGQARIPPADYGALAAAAHAARRHSIELSAFETRRPQIVEWAAEVARRSGMQSLYLCTYLNRWPAAAGAPCAFTRSLVAREHKERRLLAMLRAPVDFGQAPGVAATLLAITSDIFALTDYGNEAPPSSGVLADRAFWAQICERGLHWAIETGDAFTAARMALCTRALGLADQVPALPRALDALRQLQEVDGSLGPTNPHNPNAQRDGVLAAILAWAADL